VLDEDFALAPFLEVIAHLHRELGLSPPTFGEADGDDRDDDDPDDEAEGELATSPTSTTTPADPPHPKFSSWPGSTRP